MQSFFYDEQIRRFLLQFTRGFSNFSVEYGRDANGAPTLLRVPVRYGDSTRQVSTVMQENSSSALPSTPIMTFYIAGMDYDRPRMQEPYFVSNTQVRQRTYDSETETYETTQGNAFTIERLMPVPYKMTINLDIWTSNTNQKMQLFEQIATLFNPALEIQSTDNYLDWTSLSVVELESTTWSSRTIPQGTENPIDIMTMRFTLPIWISSPAKVKKLGVVEKIITSLYDANGDALNAITNSDLLLGTRQLFTPYGYQSLLIGNKLQALKQSAVVNPTNDNTLAPIDAVINPSISGPGAGLPSAVVGQRYLILENMGESPAWGNCIAATNDIIEYTESGWQVAFSAGTHYNNTQFVTNLTTSIQYRWTGETWVKSYEGLYPGGEWSIVL